MSVDVPDSTVRWLLGEDNPAVATLTRRTVLDEADTPESLAVWARRNDYPPVAAILAAVHDDGSWDIPSRDYQKYRGSLWQIVLLGELWANPEDDRVQRGIDYAFSRQLADGSWSCNGRPSASIPCLTANVARGIARMGYAEDDRIIAAVGYCVSCFREFGCPDCGSMYSAREDKPKWTGARSSTLNGYCHMLTPKVLLLLGQVPRRLWPEGADELRQACVDALRDKEVFRSLPVEARDFQDLYWSTPSGERDGLRERFLAEHPTLHYKDKAGWLRFGFPLSYNSDALEALLALAAVGEGRRPEYGPAIDAVASSADGDMRWKLRTTHNGKMFGDVEAKGQPSKWVTLRALQALKHFAE